MVRATLRHGLRHVDYMSVDVQGGELAALRTINFSKVEVDVIGVEQMELARQGCHGGPAGCPRTAQNGTHAKGNVRAEAPA